jgi:Glycogen recognition site of AMP-activated protein kinase
VKRRILWLLVAATTGAAPAAAQTGASVAFGVGTVRYEGGAGFSSASLAPALRYTAPTFVADGSGSIASLPGGVWASQGRLALWGATPPLGRGLRLSADGILAGTTRSDGGWTSAAHGLGELVWSAPTWGIGVGAGPSAGWIANDTSVTALHTRVRLWWQPSGATGGGNWQLFVEPTRFGGAWFTDASAGVTLERGPAVLWLGAAMRLSSAYGSTGAGSTFLQLYVAPSVSLELGGGSYLRDPYQGLPRGGFLTLGVRFHGSPRPAWAAVPKWSPLVPQARGDSLVVRFRFRDAHSVAIAGDWNAWQTIPLRPVGVDVWEGSLGLARGLHHFNLLVDGTDWVVPNGVATVPDGFGGMVATRNVTLWVASSAA